MECADLMQSEARDQHCVCVCVYPEGVVNVSELSQPSVFRFHVSEPRGRERVKKSTTHEREMDMLWER